MPFWESKLGAVVVVLLLAWALVVGVTGWRVHLATHPARQPDAGIDFESMLLNVEPVEFSSVDGVRLAGWIVDGDPGRPMILLCHDRGSSKASLVDLAVDLNSRGFHAFLFDFRGHGASGGEDSTFGLLEKRDILGALDLIAERRGSGAARVGIYGVGMGAHAAVLAAIDRPALRVLVLDGLFPDASVPLARDVFAGWSPGVRHLSFLSNGLFAMLRRVRVGEHRAADALPGLVGRDVLLLAPAGDPWLAAEMHRMARSIPEQRDVDGNLEIVPATHGDGLYGELLARHRARVAEFFETRLGAEASR